MNKLSAALSSLLALSACAIGPGSSSWHKESASAEQTEHDRLQCERQARLSAPSASAPSYRGINAGSGSGVSDGLANAERQSGIANDCMRSRGYSIR